MVKVGSDFSGVGAFDQALIRLGIDYKKVFACDWDKYARQTYIHNYGEPDYFPMDVYDREIPSDPLDIYMSSCPCQTFSMAGKRLGEADKRGILFYNSHEFIQKNNPRFFIFENVKGLLSTDNGMVFNKWVEYLGGKSINGNPVLFPHPESVPYHIYWKVLNAKNYGIPQNRERVFIVGIRDDADNNFTWPKEIFLEKRLRDVLEKDVDDKDYLSDTMAGGLIIQSGKMFINQDTQASQVYSRDGLSPNICAGTHGYANGYIDETPEYKIGAIRGRNPKNPSDRTTGAPTEQRLEINHNGTSNTLTSVQKDNVLVIKHQRTEEAKAKRRESLSKGKDSGNFADREMILVEQEYSDTILANMNPKKEGLIAVNEVVQFNQEPQTFDGYRIRRLTPREAFHLMDFNEDFIERTLNYKKYLYFQFVYSKFDINKKETLCNAKLKVVKDTQTPKNLETYVLCTTKECQKMDALTTLKQRREIKTENNENPLNVNFAIEVLGELERKECVTNTIKWTDCTETLYMLMKEGKNQVVKDISEIQKDKSYIEKSLKITLEENLSEEKLFITLILLKQIMTSKIYTYVKMPLNTQRFISSTVVYEKKSERLLLSYLKMEYTEQVVSDSMLYKQAGNSICVGVLAGIISKLNL